MRVLEFFLAVCCFQIAQSVSLDHEKAKELEEVIKSNNFVISLKHIKPRRRLRGSVEALLAVDFPGSQQKFVIVLDRRGKRVVIETVEDGRTRAQHFTVDNLEDGTLIRSMVLSVNQRHPNANVALYVDCVSQGTISMPRTLKDMFLKMKNPHLQVYRERRYTLEIEAHADLGSVLNRNNCPINQMQAIQPANNEINPFRRGDIPVLNDCDDKDSILMKTLNQLIEIIKQLKSELEHQRAETISLRRILEECQVCRETW